MFRMTLALLACLFAAMSIWGHPAGDVTVTRASTTPALASLGAPPPRPRSTGVESQPVSEREAVTLALAAGDARETAVVRTAAPVAEPEAEEDRLLRYVNGSRVNLRDGPTTNSSIVGTVTRGDRAEVLSDSGSWVRIRTDQGVEAWIFGRFLSETPA